VDILNDVKTTVTRTLASGTSKVGSSAVLIRESGTYNVASGTTNTVENRYSGTGFAQSISDKYMDDSVSPNDGREIVIYRSTLTDDQGKEVEPDVGDEVEFDGIRYDAVVVDTGPSKTLWTVVGRA